jgi:outer membrane protein assembly factor BamA
MLILNNELRFPFISILDAVGFVDIGNVYPSISDFSFSDLRKTAGFGLRLRTPFLLLRFDYDPPTAEQEKAGVLSSVLVRF